MPPSNTPQATPPDADPEGDATAHNNAAGAMSMPMSMSTSMSSSSPTPSRYRTFLRDLDRLERRRLMSAEPGTAASASVSAPANDDHEDDDDEDADDDRSRRQRLQRVLARLTRLQDSRRPYGAPPTQQSLYDWAPTAAANEVNNDNNNNDDDDQARRRHNHRRHDSLRSTAIMHNARTSGSLRTRDNPSPEPHEHTRAYRRGYLADNPTLRSSTDPPRSSPLLESAVQYLDHVRFSSSYHESLCLAMDHGLFIPDNYDDFITDSRCCPRPQPSSWLAPGAVFQGSQHTTSTKDIHWSALRSSPAAAFDATRPWLSHTPTLPVVNTSPRDVQDRWPVKVTLQAVDYDKMIMAGTMEAYDVPNASYALSSSSASSKQTAPITTYLEGQIVDFGVHTFLTPAATPQPRGIAFPPTSAVTDAANWRNLPPFNTMKSDEDVARALVSRTQMTHILSEWVFMRWKERCFIHSKSDPCHRNEHSSSRMVAVGEGDDTDTGHGLTISGFYYVSLRRSDGNISGLYFDTRTSPYQHLRLEAKNGGKYGVWEFR